MILKEIHIEAFRNYDKINVSNFKSINLIHGENGHGKTSFIEAIYYTALTQSFKAKNDLDCINFNAKESTFFNIEASFQDKHLNDEKVRIFYGKKEGKNLFLNGDREKKLKNHIGFIPIVLIKPDDNKLTFGAPADRRKFLDLFLSQISPIYLDSLIRYKKLIKHKNAILSKFANNSEDLIKTWNKEIVKHASIIIRKRNDIIKEIEQETAMFYKKISNQSRSITITYNSPVDGFSNIEEQFEHKLNAIYESEVFQRKSLLGPHRDDYVFKIDDKIVGQYGSQGENKTFLISLKMAELELLKRYITEKPILLFDDIFSELDQFRINHLMEMIQDVGQIFITSTDDKLFKNLNINRINIEKGMVVN